MVVGGNVLRCATGLWTGYAVAVAGSPLRLALVGNANGLLGGNVPVKAGSLYGSFRIAFSTASAVTSCDGLTLLVSSSNDMRSVAAIYR